MQKNKRKKGWGVEGVHAPQYFLKFLWIMLQYATIQYAIFKPYAASKMELFGWKTVVDCFYIELRLKCDRVPRSHSEMHRFR